VWHEVDVCPRGGRQKKVSFLPSELFFRANGKSSSLSTL
jgi:hypothetical protein